MTKKRKILIYQVLFILFTLIFNNNIHANNKYNNSPLTQNKIQEIYVTNTYIKMIIGESYYITFSVFPENVEDTTVIFSSQDSSVASVQQDGTIKAISIGKTFVNVTSQDGNVNAKILVVVISPESTKYSGLIIFIEVLIITIGLLIFIKLCKKQLKKLEINENNIN